MATDATFDNQLQALANATATFASDKDTAIKNTIITALGGSTQQGGGNVTLHVDDSNIDQATFKRDIAVATIEGGVRIGFGGQDPEGAYLYGYIDVTYSVE